MEENQDLRRLALSTKENFAEAYVMKNIKDNSDLLIRSGISFLPNEHSISEKPTILPAGDYWTDWSGKF